MIRFRIRNERLCGMVTNLGDTSVEVIKDGEVVCRIYPTAEGIEISFMILQAQQLKPRFK